jgi:hypothetical protein
MRAAQRDWVAAAAERAEQRLRGEIPSPFCQSIDQSATLATQLEALTKAILDRQISRKKLRQLAQALNTGRVS